MKRIFLLLALTLAVLPLAAQEISAGDSAILNQILAKNKQYRTMQGPFQHEMIRKGERLHKAGTYYYERVAPQKTGEVEAKIAMRYHDPEGEYFVITTTHLYNGLNGRHKVFRYKYFSIMKLLGNAMAWAANGDVYSICNNFNTKLKLTADERYYIVSLTSEAGLNKGINRMVFKYNKSTCMISYMEIEEKIGITHKYSLGTDSSGRYHQPTLNEPIDPKVYIVE